VSDPQLHQDLGRLQGEFKALKEQVSGIETKVSDVHDVMMKAQGGWRAMVIVGSISAFIGAGLVKLLGLIWR
jgi:hypothetical protein